MIDLLATRPTSPQQVVIMEFGKRHDTTDTTDFCPRQLVTYGLAMGKLPTGVMDFGLCKLSKHQFARIAMTALNI